MSQTLLSQLWVRILIVFLALGMFSVAVFYFWKFYQEPPSYPIAQTTQIISPSPTPSMLAVNVPTVTPTPMEINTVVEPDQSFYEKMVDYLVDNFFTSELLGIFDFRYLGLKTEVDPVWGIARTGYYLKSEADLLLGGKSESSHSHNELYYIDSETDALLELKSDTSHAHGDLYYTETEVGNLLTGKSDLGHTHDSDYYTEAEVNTQLGLKSDSTHLHDDRYYTETETDASVLSSVVLGGASGVLPIQRNYDWIDQMESGWSNFYGNGTVSFDTSDYMSGTSSVKVITSSNATNSGARKTLAAPENWLNKFIKILVKSSDWDNLQEVKLLVSTSGQFVEYFQVNIRPMLTYPGDHDGEWVEFIVPTSSFTEVNTPDWTTVNQLIVRAIGVNGQTPSIWFDEYAVVDRASDSMLSIVFDDGHSSDYVQARQVMEKYGYKGNLFIAPTLIGTSGRLTQSQVDIMHNSGWEISGHGDTNLVGLTNEQIQTELETAKDYLLSRGYRGGEIYAYPNGGHNENIRNTVQKYFSLARTIANFNQPITYMNPTMLHARVVHDDDSVATVEGWIDDAVADNEWVILVFHRITDGAPASETEYSRSDFESIVDHVNSSGVEVLPIVQAIERMKTF